MVGTARLRTEKVKVALNTISLQVRVTSTWERTEVGEGKMGWGRREVGSQRVAGVRGGGRGCTEIYYTEKTVPMRSWTRPGMAGTSPAMKI